MDKSLEDRLRRGLDSRFPYVSGLRAEAIEDGFQIRVAEGDPLLTLTFWSGEWTVADPHAHAHRDLFEEAMDLAFALLTGDARSAKEFRGDTLASTWIELRQGEIYEMEDVAAFLSPFEAEEWTLWPGERWRVVRQTLRLDGVEQREEFERVADVPTGAGPSMLEALENALGTLPEGLRWAVDGQSRFVYPAPRGWRRRNVDRELRETHNMAEFAPPEAGLLLRKRGYFRDATAPFPRPDAQTFRPHAVERGLPEPEGVPPGWSRHAWTFQCSNGEEEMMGVIELFFTEKTRSVATALWRSIEPALNDARFVPGSWTMHPEV